MTEPAIFSVTNHHVPGCGTPPRIDDAAPGQYRGYFENEYGEQAVFVYDRTMQQGTLYLGDAGWETAYRVRDGVVPGLILSQLEQAWLRTCWTAVRGSEVGAHTG